MNTYFSYNIGSYWVYESDSNFIDTISIVNKDKLEFNCQHATNYDYTRYTYNLHSTYYHGEETIFISPKKDAPSNGINSCDIQNIFLEPSTVGIRFFKLKYWGNL